MNKNRSSCDTLGGGSASSTSPTLEHTIAEIRKTLEEISDITTDIGTKLYGPKPKNECEAKVPINCMEDALAVIFSR